MVADVGEFVRISLRDDKGKCSYVGEVVKHIKPTKKNNETEALEVLTFDGTIGLKMPLEDDTEVNKVNTKPKGWAKFKKDPQAYMKAKEEETPVVTPQRTAKEEVFEIVKENKRKGEKTLLKLCKEKIGASKSDATIKNYIKLAKSKLK